MDTSIVNLIIDQANEHLIADLQTNVPASDPTRAVLIRPGLLQDNPLAFNVIVLTYANDPDDPNGWRHSISQNQGVGFQNPPSFETGGGQLWYRRFTTTLELYWPTNYDRQLARQYANVILSRTENSFWTRQFQNLFDTFGEAALQTYVINSHLSDAGGPGQFIQHCKIWWQVLTAKADVGGF